MNKNITIIIVCIVIAAAALGGYFLYQNKNIEKVSDAQRLEMELRAAIEGNIENWALYKKVTAQEDKKFGNDVTCPASITGNTDFMDYEKKAVAGDAYKLDLSNGAYLIYTPNYNNWDNAKLNSFGVTDMRICSEGFLTPLYAYSDKILWGNITCITASEEDNINMCLTVNRIVLGYFTQKTSQ